MIDYLLREEGLSQGFIKPEDRSLALLFEARQSSRKYAEGTVRFLSLSAINNNPTKV